MPKSIPPALSLDPQSDLKSISKLSPPALSPVTPRSPKSLPSSPNQTISRRGVTTQKKGNPDFASNPLSNMADSRQDIERTPASPITAIPPYPASPTTESPKHGRDASKSFFLNIKASRSSNRLNAPENSSKTASKADLTSRGSSKDRNLYSSSRGHESTPDLQSFTPSERTQDNSSQYDEVRPATRADKTGSENESAAPSVPRKGKGKFGILTRTRSIRLDDATKNTKAMQGRAVVEADPEEQVQEFPDALRTAPLQQDRTFWGSMNRNRSADRQNPQLPTSNSQWMAGLKHAGSKAADGLGKTGKGLLNKMVRSGSSTEKEMLVETPYVLQIINLPLVEQTRRTRISKRLESSRDKTEFWMPALPWRCIDFLNANGCEEEGLYRVPGSGKDIKRYERRFDTELDINLFEQNDLYDINTVGSMFKNWLRGLPDPIIPKETQLRIQNQCQGAKVTPQLMKDELSKLPPFNYYLLFAITCHLSLLLSYTEKNRMNYQNLLICFQPSIKIDAFCFHFLVLDWKNCWQGCWTEKEFLEEEYKFERERLYGVQAIEPESNGHSNHSEGDERAISSSESHKAEIYESAPQTSPGSGSVEAMNDNGFEEDHTRHYQNNKMKADAQRLSLGLPPLSPIKIPVNGAE